MKLLEAHPYVCIDAEDINSRHLDHLRMLPPRIEPQGSYVGFTEPMFYKFINNGGVIRDQDYYEALFDPMFPGVIAW